MSEQSGLPAADLWEERSGAAWVEARLERRVLDVRAGRHLAPLD